MQWQLLRYHLGRFLQHPDVWLLTLLCKWMDKCRLHVSVAFRTITLNDTPYHWLPMNLISNISIIILTHSRMILYHSWYISNSPSWPSRLFQPISVAREGWWGKASALHMWQVEIGCQQIFTRTLSSIIGSNAAELLILGNWHLQSG